MGGKVWSEEEINYVKEKFGKIKSEQFVEAFGETKTLQQWSIDNRCVGISPITIKNRIKSGWIPEDAITTPTLQAIKIAKQSEPVNRAHEEILLAKITQIPSY